MLKEKLAALNLMNMNAQQKHSLLRMAVSIAIGLGLATALILLTSDKPMESLRYYFTAPLQNASYFSYWVQKTIPLIFTGTAVCIMFSANQFNLGLEGSFLFGGLVAAVINIYVTPFNPTLGIPLSLIAGALVGSLITFIPALLDRLFNASIMVTSLMMNYICLWFSTYLLFSHLKDPRSSKNSYNWAEKDPIMVLKFGKGNQQLTIYFSILIALLVVVLAWFFLYRTKTGYKLRTVGVNHNFARYVGINAVSIAIVVQLIGGAIGGIGGACEIMSNYINYSWVDLTGFGWDGVTIAIFAKNNPKNVPLAAIFIAFLRTGAMVMSYKTNIQNDLTSVIEGVVILFLLAEKFLSKTYRKMIVKETEENRRLEAELQKKEAN